MVVSLLTSGVNAHSIDANRNTPLLIASQQGWCLLQRKGGHIVERLLESGVDVDYEAEEIDTALTQAAYAGEIEVLKILLAGGANINWTNVFGQNALYHAAQVGNTDVVRLLLQDGVFVNGGSWDRIDTPLITAASWSQNDVIKTLLMEYIIRQLLSMRISTVT